MSDLYPPVDKFTTLLNSLHGVFVCSHVQDSVNAEYVNYWLLRYDLHKNILECFEIGVGFDKKKVPRKAAKIVPAGCNSCGGFGFPEQGHPSEIKS